MASALDTLEEAVELLRGAGLSVVARHWVGSVPLAFGLLAYWRVVTAYRVPGAMLAGAATALTLLWLWMNCWRAWFAIGLRQRLSGEAGELAVGRIIASQAALGGLKLLVWPFAALTAVPFAAVVAFFRSAAVYADAGPLEAARRARRVAGYAAGQTWAGMAILSGLSIAIFLNIAIALALLPQLAKMLTGYESAFTRAGSNLVLNPLFFLTAALCTWLAMDPLVQAWHCVRSFRGESVESGADLRAALRLIRKMASLAAAVTLLWLALPIAVRAQVAPAELDRAVRQTLRAPEYDWRLPPDDTGRHAKPWLAVVTDRIVAQFRRALNTLTGWIEELFRRWFKPGRIEREGGAAPMTALQLSVYLALALALAAGSYAVWRLRRKALPDTAAAASALPPVDLADEHLTADRLPEQEWLALAERCLREGDFRAALRALYLGNLAWLHATNLITIHSGKTNREYERELRRRARAAPEAGPLLAENIAAYERCWYGVHTAGVDDIDGFRGRAARLKEVAA